MISSPKPDKLINAIGMLCPLPVIKLSDAVKSIAVGEICQLTATDPGALKDVQDWCKANKHKYIGDEQEGRMITIWVEKQ